MSLANITFIVRTQVQKTKQDNLLDDWVRTRCYAIANHFFISLAFYIVGILQEEGWPSSQALGGWVPKWAQEALGSLITCRQCSNAINEVDPGNGPVGQFHFKNRQTFLWLLFSMALFLNCLGDAGFLMFRM